jgi:hypothetical protein
LHRGGWGFDGHDDSNVLEAACHTTYPVTMEQIMVLL